MAAHPANTWPVRMNKAEGGPAGAQSQDGFPELPGIQQNGYAGWPPATRGDTPFVNRVVT